MDLGDALKLAEALRGAGRGLTDNEQAIVLLADEWNRLKAKVRWLGKYATHNLTCIVERDADSAEGAPP